MTIFAYCLRSYSSLILLTVILVWYRCSVVMMFDSFAIETVLPLRKTAENPTMWTPHQPHCPDSYQLSFASVKAS